jgi:hypothetical protein
VYFAFSAMEKSFPDIKNSALCASNRHAKKPWLNKKIFANYKSRLYEI